MKAADSKQSPKMVAICALKVSAPLSQRPRSLLSDLIKATDRSTCVDQIRMVFAK